MMSTRVSLWGGNEYVDCIVSPPSVPMPIGFITSTGPSSTKESARVGGLLPEQWAALFRKRRDLLFPVLPWLEVAISQIPGMRSWQIRVVVDTIQVLLCHVGLDKAALVQRSHNNLGAFTAPLMERLVDVIVILCGPEARRLLRLPEPNNAQQHEDGREEPGVEQQHEDGRGEPGVAQQHEDGPAAPSGPAASPQGTVAPSAAPYDGSAGPEAEELPGTSGGALGGGAAELPAAPSPGQRERPGDEPGPEAAGPSEQGRSRGPSARGRGGKRSAGGPRRPTKRRAASAQRAPPPRKRRPPRRP
ncbi:hypothetical protein ASZ78_002665 [Callipepla squamata]|uniref:Uncharacterized protein n=1 Tax=Callipepla squamata TaxID=9009 RepID=A0A226MET3_CALSU|nr:hypothetical protein ASZ78_002665 [Callipepla squamata]